LLRHNFKPFIGGTQPHSISSRSFHDTPTPPPPPSSSDSEFDPLATLGKYDEPNAIIEIAHELRWQKKWGFAVFRTAYDGHATDEAWERLKEKIMASCRKEFDWYEEDENIPEGVLAEVKARMDFVFFSDPDSLAGASVDDVRRKFRAWAVDDSQSDEHPVPLRPKGAENTLTGEEKESFASGLASYSPRHRFLFLVDPEGWNNYIQLVRSDPRMEFDECDGGMRDVWKREEVERLKSMDDEKRRAELVRDIMDTEREDDGCSRAHCSIDAIGPDLYSDLMNPEAFYMYAPGPGSVIEYPRG